MKQLLHAIAPVLITMTLAVIIAVALARKESDLDRFKRDIRIGDSEEKLHSWCGVHKICAMKVEPAGEFRQISVHFRERGILVDTQSRAYITFNKGCLIESIVLTETELAH